MSVDLSSQKWAQLSPMQQAEKLLSLIQRQHQELEVQEASLYKGRIDLVNTNEELRQLRAELEESE